MNDPCNGFDVAVVISVKACLLGAFNFLWKNSGILPTYSVYTISKSL
jgi:hypothetical protein